MNLCAGGFHWTCVYEWCNNTGWRPLVRILHVLFKKCYNSAVVCKSRRVQYAKECKEL